jgi:hypothetical protein
MRSTETYLKIARCEFTFSEVSSSDDERFAKVAVDQMAKPGPGYLETCKMMNKQETTAILLIDLSPVLETRPT